MQAAVKVTFPQAGCRPACARPAPLGSSPLPSAAPPRARVVAHFKEERAPFDKESLKDHIDSQEGFPLSLFRNFGNKLPEEGEIQTEKEAKCDPEVSKCQTPMYTYESKCKACFGTGSIHSRSKGHRISYTCPSCSGLGMVRRTTSRFIPEYDPSANGAGEVQTLLRPKKQEKKQKKGRIYIG